MEYILQKKEYFFFKISYLIYVLIADLCNFIFWSLNCFPFFVVLTEKPIICCSTPSGAGACCQEHQLLFKELYFYSRTIILEQVFFFVKTFNQGYTQTDLLKKKVTAVKSVTTTPSLPYIFFLNQGIASTHSYTHFCSELD